MASNTLMFETCMKIDVLIYEQINQEYKIINTIKIKIQNLMSFNILLDLSLLKSGVWKSIVFILYMWRGSSHVLCLQETEEFDHLKPFQQEASLQLKGKNSQGLAIYLVHNFDCQLNFPFLWPSTRRFVLEFSLPCPSPSIC